MYPWGFVAFPKHQVLYAKVAVAPGLEQPAAPESPGDLLRTKKQIAHFHDISRKPID